MREPRADRRAALDGLTCDERLENGADSRTGGITVAALLDCPCESDDADDDIGSGGDAFFSDEEMQLTRPGLAEACKQSLLRNRVLNEVDVSVEMEPKWIGADVSHGDNGRQISFLAATDQRHGGAAP